MSQIISTIPTEQKRTELTETERHRLLSDTHRRELLRIASARSESLDLGDLAIELANQASDLDGDDEATIQRVSVSLHHHHLPMMEDYGILDYDTEANRIDF